MKVYRPAEKNDGKITSPHVGGHRMLLVDNRENTAAQTKLVKGIRAVAPIIQRSDNHNLNVIQLFSTKKCNNDNTIIEKAATARADAQHFDCQDNWGYIHTRSGKEYTAFSGNYKHTEDKLINDTGLSQNPDAERPLFLFTERYPCSHCRQLINDLYQCYSDVTIGYFIDGKTDTKLTPGLIRNLYIPYWMSIDDPKVKEEVEKMLKASGYNEKSLSSLSPHKYLSDEDSDGNSQDMEGHLEKEEYPFSIAAKLHDVFVTQSDNLDNCIKAVYTCAEEIMKVQKVPNEQFEIPVDSSSYLNTIKEPRSMSSIMLLIDNKKYKSIDDIYNDIILCFENYLLFYNPEDEMTKKVKYVNDIFKSAYKDAHSKMNDSNPLPPTFSG